MSSLSFSISMCASFNARFSLLIVSDSSFSKILGSECLVLSGLAVDSLGLGILGTDDSEGVFGVLPIWGRDRVSS